jgi:hypothetical protein
MRTRVVAAAAAIAGAVAIWRRRRRFRARRRKPRPHRRRCRAADGHPDLTGTYDLATMAPVERAAGSPLVLTDEQAAKSNSRPPSASKRWARRSRAIAMRAARRRRIGKAGRERRRLQQFLDRRRVPLRGHRRTKARLDSHRPAGRTDSGGEAEGGSG